MKLTTSINRYFFYLLISSLVSSKLHCINFDIGEKTQIVSEEHNTKPCKGLSSIGIDSFIGSCNGKQIIIKWVALSDIVNNYFTIERSYDGINWTEIGVVSASFTYSEKSAYSFTDSEIKDDISYYRLKHADYSEIFSYSKIIDVNTCYNELTEGSVMLYPNPSIGIYNLSVSRDKNLPQTVEIFNHLGEKIYQSDDCIRTIDLSGNPIGLYFAHFNFNEKVIIRKIVLRKD